MTSVAAFTRQAAISHLRLLNLPLASREPSASSSHIPTMSALSELPQRQTVQIPFGRARMSAWFWPSPTATKQRPGPAIVLGHGLGGFKSMRLDAYGEVVQKEGYSALAFDYRGFGDSTGSPAQVLDYGKQQDDWEVVLDYTRNLDVVGARTWPVLFAPADPSPSADADQIAIFGTSFGGGESNRKSSGFSLLNPRLEQPM